MNEWNVGNEFRNLVQHAAPLIDWYRKNKPQVNWLRVRPEQSLLLRKYPKKAASAGFEFRDGEIYLKGFRILSTHPATPENPKKSV